jgi:hypothetical protein
LIKEGKKGKKRKAGRKEKLFGILMIFKSLMQQS